MKKELKDLIFMKVAFNIFSAIVTFVSVSLILILSFSSCSKALEKETPLPDMIIDEVKGSTWNGDSLSSCTPQYLGYFLGNNNITITGKNFGNSTGEVSVDFPEFVEVNIINWEDGAITLGTEADQNRNFRTDIKFTIIRDDAKKIDFSKRMVTDIEGYIVNSPTWFIFDYYMSVFKKPILDEFIENMDSVETDYIPTKYDILRDKDGLKVINSTPSVSANAYQKKYTFETVRMSCDEKFVMKTETFTVLNDAIVPNADTPISYYRE